MIESAIAWLLNVIAAPEVGLSSVFIISFISATLVPLGSEPAVFAVIKANPELFWSAIAVATVGNTLGGAVDYWMGYQAKQTFAKERKSRWFHWLERYGAKTMLLAWLQEDGMLDAAQAATSLAQAALRPAPAVHPLCHIAHPALTLDLQPGVMRVTTQGLEIALDRKTPAR